MEIGTLRELLIDFDLQRRGNGDRLLA